jgi:hypothetical protein
VKRICNAASVTNALPEEEEDIVVEEEVHTRKRISLNKSTGTWEHIDDADMAMWREAGPALDIANELAKAAAWCIANGAKGHKRDYRRFLTNWIIRAQDSGRSSKAVPAQPAMPTAAAVFRAARERGVL